MQNPQRYRSFFWPIVLIGVGAIWLLVNLNIISLTSLNNLVQLWPVILIVLGLNMLFGHQNSWIGAAIGVLAIGAVIGFLVFGPALGLTSANPSNVQVETFTTPLEKTTSANFVLDLSAEPVDIHALSNSTELINAKIGHTGTMVYTVTGSETKSVQLSQISNPSNWFRFDFSFVNLKWDVGLTPQIPVGLTMDGGSGSVTADLSGLKLSSLQASMGSGSSNFTLPESTQAYQAKINSGSGSVNIHLPAHTNLTLQLDSGSGSLNISLPAGAAVRVEVLDSGSGSLNLPSNLQSAGTSAGNGMGEWQTAGYDTAATKLLIKITNRGSGSVNIH